MFNITTSSHTQTKRGHHSQGHPQKTHTHTQMHTLTGTCWPMTAPLWKHVTFLCLFSAPALRLYLPSFSLHIVQYLSRSLSHFNFVGLSLRLSVSGSISRLPPSSALLSPKLTVMNESETERERVLGWGRGRRRSHWREGAIGLQQIRMGARCYCNRTNGMEGKSHSWTAHFSQGGAVSCQHVFPFISHHYLAIAQMQWPQIKQINYTLFFPVVL